MVTLTAWGGTGYNGVNTPRAINPETLPDKYLVLTEVSIDVCQIYNLSYIRVPCSEIDAFEIDYIRLNRDGYLSYYTVAGIPVMTSPDIAQIPVLQEPFSTLGGATSLVAQAGAIKRTSYGAASTGGRNDLLDPMFVPKYPANHKYLYAGRTGDSSQTDYIMIVASTVKLDDPRASEPGFEPSELYTVDPETGKVTANYTASSGGWTDIEIVIPGELANGADIALNTRTSGYGLYLAENPTVQANITALWAAGDASSVIGSYAIPAEYFEVTTKTSAGAISKIKSKPYKKDFGAPFSPYELYKDYAGPDADLVKNNANIITYSGTYRVGIISPLSGSQLVTKAYNTTNSVYLIGDPRPGGKMYCIMPDMLREESTGEFEYSIAMLFTRAIPCGEWQTIPIVNDGAQGWAKDIANTVLKGDMENYRTEWNNVAGGYRNVSGIADSAIGAMGNMTNWEIRDYDTSRRAIARAGTSRGYIDSTTPVTTGGLTSQTLDLLGNAVGSLLNGVGVGDDVTGAISSNSRNRLLREQEANREISTLFLDAIYVSPTVSGIPETSWQGLISNGVIIYCEYPDPEDVKNWARIIRSYGLVSTIVIGDGVGNASRQIAPLVDTDDPYGYIQIAGAALTTKTRYKSRSLLEDAAAALSVGVRFWSRPPAEGG